MSILYYVFIFIFFGLALFFIYISEKPSVDMLVKTYPEYQILVPWLLPRIFTCPEIIVNPPFTKVGHFFGQTSELFKCILISASLSFVDCNRAPVRSLIAHTYFIISFSYLVKRGPRTLFPIYSCSMDLYGRMRPNSQPKERRIQYYPDLQVNLCLPQRL